MSFSDDVEEPQTKLQYLDSCLVNFCGMLGVKRIACNKLLIFLQLFSCACHYEVLDWIHTVGNLLFCVE